MVMGEVLFNITNMKGVSKVIDSENGKIYCFFNGSYKIIREYENLVELFEDETNIYCNLITSNAA